MPRHNATGTIGYEPGPVGVLLHGRHYDAWTDVTGELFQRFEGIALFDASVTWRVTPKLSLRGGAENIFDA